MARDESWHDRLWRFLESYFGHGLVAVGMLFGPVDARAAGGLPAGDPEVEGTAALHPERVRADVPLSPLERELARELRLR